MVLPYICALLVCVPLPFIALQALRNYRRISEALVSVRTTKLPVYAERDVKVRLSSPVQWGQGRIDLSVYDGLVVEVWHGNVLRAFDLGGSLLPRVFFPRMAIHDAVPRLLPPSEPGDGVCLQLVWGWPIRHRASFSLGQLSAEQLGMLRQALRIPIGTGDR